MSQIKDTIVVDSIEHFITITMAWHKKKVQILKQMREIPKGSEVAVDGGDPVVLSDAGLAGFQAGIDLAIIELGTLPFAAELEEAPTPNVG